METERLYLRENDLQLMEEVLQRSTEAQLAFFGLEDVAQLSTELAKMEKRMKNTLVGWKKWDLIKKADGRVIGSCGFHNWLQEHERAELGYKLHESFHGQGLMTEALVSIVAHGFQEMSLNRIEAFISPDNLPSRKLIERLGFTQEGVLRSHYKHQGHILDSVVYSLLRSEHIR